MALIAFLHATPPRGTEIYSQQTLARWRLPHKLLLSFALSAFRGQINIRDVLRAHETRFLRSICCFEINCLFAPKSIANLIWLKFVSSKVCMSPSPPRSAELLRWCLPVCQLKTLRKPFRASFERKIFSFSSPLGLAKLRFASFFGGKTMSSTEIIEELDGEFGSSFLWCFAKINRQFSRFTLKGFRSADTFDNRLLLPALEGEWERLFFHRTSWGRISAVDAKGGTWSSR